MREPPTPGEPRTATAAGRPFAETRSRGGKPRTAPAAGTAFAEIRSARQLHRTLGGWAGRRKGLLTRAGLLELGMPATTVDTWVRRRWLVVIQRGVYALGHAALPPLAEELAAVLSLGPGAVAGHWSAGRVQGLPVPAPGRFEPVHVLVPGRRMHCRAGRPPHQRPVHVHFTPSLDGRDVTVRHGVPVTTVARTLVDLAGLRQVSDGRLERLVDVAVTERRVTVAALRDARGRATDPHAIRRLTALLDPSRRAARTRSDLERAFLALLRRAELPEPLVNEPYEGFELDFYWPEQSVAVELDGLDYHLTRTRRARDARKDALLRAREIVGLRFDETLFDARPELVLAQVAAALAGGGRSGRPAPPR